MYDALKSRESCREAVAMMVRGPWPKRPKRRVVITPLIKCLTTGPTPTAPIIIPTNYRFLSLWPKESLTTTRSLAPNSEPTVLVATASEEGSFAPLWVLPEPSITRITVRNPCEAEFSPRFERRSLEEQSRRVQTGPEPEQPGPSFTA